MPQQNDIQESILSWFDCHKRNLPWRKTYLPYHIWISEIMLQQTQMDRVVLYFQRWLEHFPDIATLSQATEHEVLKLWEGLGYYSRAKNILKSAKILCAEHNCALPQDHAALLKLPGIGKYTAGAIMSLAFNQDYPVVDANVERVFTRLFDISLPVKEKESQHIIWSKAHSLLPGGKARFFNQALMELGALVCLPKSPHCEKCPLNTQCEAYELGLVDQRPVPGKAKETIFIEMASGILIHNGKVFIQQRHPDDVWPNLWEFPGGVLQKGERPQEALTREFAEETEFAIKQVTPIRIIKHNYTKYKVTLHCFTCKMAGNNDTPVLHAAQDYRWLTLDELDGFAFPSPHRKLINIFKDELRKLLAAS